MTATSWRPSGARPGYGVPIALRSPRRRRTQVAGEPDERPFLARRTAGQWVRIGAVALSVVVVVCLVLAALAVIQAARARAELVDRQYPAEAAGLRILTGLVNMETGVRGYALTGDATFLAPYQGGSRQSREAFDELDALSRSHARSKALTTDLETARRSAEDWRRFQAEPLIAEVRRARGEPVARSRVEDGRASFDRVRVALRRMNAGIVAARVEGRAHLDDAVTRLLAAVIAVAVALLLAAVAVAVGLRRGISDPLARLGEQVREVAQGDLHRVVATSGPADVVELARDVDSMRRRIVDDLQSVEDARSTLEDQTAALERQTRDLERSNAELEQFAYVASHDLQEPLRKVASFCQLLQRRYQGQLDERADTYIEYAVDGAKRMQSLITDLLTFSRVGRTELVPVPVDLGDALRDALDNLDRAIDIRQATVEASPLPDVMGEHTLLVAVFQNLIGNAVKFAGDAPPVVRVDVDREGNEWVVSVSDEGIGIEPQYAERIFAIFQRLHPKEAFEGTGIGLSLTRKIIEHHGGRIWLDTSVPRGTTFRFTLPVVQEVPT